MIGPIQSTICDVAWELAEDGRWPCDDELAVTLAANGIEPDQASMHLTRWRLRVERAKRGIWGGAR